MMCAMKERDGDSEAFFDGLHFPYTSSLLAFEGEHIDCCPSFSYKHVRMCVALHGVQATEPQQMTSHAQDLL